MTCHQDALRDGLKRAASALKAHGPSFALAGGYALWVHGAPEPVHDVDLVVAETDSDAAAATLAAAGFQIERTPEDWLFKASTSTSDGAVVDVLHRVDGVAVDPDLLGAADTCDVLAISMPVLSATVVTCQRLLALHEHHCNLGLLLPATRAIREQVDWTHVRQATVDDDFAAAFLFLVERLGIVAAPE
ncbi:hypothetical protein H7K45_11970 [Mycobacterium yunnanensis]|uniref:Nucleotidyltransferase n=1 Tax=Mycobacterium yunnanensis TaxID=368477 RepID=A0A9X2Z0G6_9MYCO|nr:hypothetical protein [Mycobacterium yunnanensis]MCV7421259.1 hypothetical protein [Mycobacterium yunnanensis]